MLALLEGRLSVSMDAGTLSAGPGENAFMPKGETVTIRLREKGVVTAT